MLCFVEAVWPLLGGDPRLRRAAKLTSVATGVEMGNHRGATGSGAASRALIVSAVRLG
jgi:hypothetical protein